MTKKYLCPKHREDTPSAVAYSDHFYCFGCGASGPLSELGIPAGERIETTYVEDIETSIRAIMALPKQEIRGFSLHADSRGYFLLWPDLSYYKRRVVGAEAGNKYRGPSGHKKPPFVAQKTGADRLILVEGEFNGLSLASLELRDWDIISPGGAGDFYSRTGAKLLEEVGRTYNHVCLITDADAPGAQAAIEAKSRLLVLGCPDVRIVLCERDLNDILVQDGKEALREEARRLGL